MDVILSPSPTVLGYLSPQAFPHHPPQRQLNQAKDQVQRVHPVEGDELHLHDDPDHQADAEHDGDLAGVTVTAQRQETGQAAAQAVEGEQHDTRHQVSMEGRVLDVIERDAQGAAGRVADESPTAGQGADADEQLQNSQDQDCPLVLFTFHDSLNHSFTVLSSPFFREKMQMPSWP